MASIKDIAKKLNLSVATVSYALRDDKKISEATKAKVTACAKELNYIYNPIASVMQGQDSKIIGVLIHDFGGNFFGDVLQGIRLELENYGYEMVVSSSLKSFEMLLHNFFDGAIIFSDRIDSKKLEEFCARNYPLVFMDREYLGQNISSVTYDNFQGVQIACEILKQVNHKLIYVLLGNDSNFDANQRKQALITMLPSLSNVELVDGDFTQECGYKFALDYQIESLDCAVLCFNDEMLLGVYRAINDKKKIGKSISLIGFDNIDLLAYLNPPLSSIGIDRQKWGQVSAQQLVSQLQGNNTLNKKMEVKMNEGKSINQLSE